MAGQREDYVMRLIDELRTFVTRAIALRDNGQLDQALHTAVQAQERLFARPAAEFAARPVDEQLRLLTLDESPDQARAKCLAYASILEEAGNVYQARARDDLAAGALQLALYVRLTVALENEPRAAELRPSIETLHSRLAAVPLSPPVRELLDKLPPAAKAAAT